MPTISDFLNISNLDRFDLEIIIAYVLKKNREFVLTYPEKILNPNQVLKINKLITRRLRHEPIAYIFKHKEFYGLNFKVTKNTLIPRPETELLIDETQKELEKQSIDTIIDIGTGSGNIIITIAHLYTKKKINYFGIDISHKALGIAKYNAKKNKLLKKINFIHGDMLNWMLREKYKLKIKNSKILILANLPYLSQKIYLSTPLDVKKYEPKSALISMTDGLAHYKKLLNQINLLQKYFFIKTIILEFSPEQKQALKLLIKSIFPDGKLNFKKDLAGKWRICLIKTT